MSLPDGISPARGSGRAGSSASAPSYARPTGEPRCHTPDPPSRAWELAAAGIHRLYRYGPGLAFLGTVRADGGPRVHPVCPTVCDGRLWVLVGAAPKLADLRRDPRYALHTFPDADTDDEFYVTGEAIPLDDDPQRERVRADLASRGVTAGADDARFELRVERALHSQYAHRGQWPPTYSKWRAPA